MILHLQADLLGAARRFSENDQKLGDLILTRHSDEEYPWPPAKAPWARERGGSGIPPAGARENYGNKKHIMMVPVAQLSGKFLAPDNVEPPSSTEEAMKMMEVGRKLMEMAMRFNGSGFREREVMVIQSMIGAVLLKAQENLACRRKRSYNEI